MNDRYFIIKCESYANLLHSFKQGTWATPLHKSNPQPHEILNEGFDNSQIHFIVGVSGTKVRQSIHQLTTIKKWQAAAIMKSKAVEDNVNTNSSRNFSPLFKVEWTKRFGNIESGYGLSFTFTENMVNSINNVPVNLSRNCQEIDASLGTQIVQQMAVEIEKEEQEKQKRLESQIKPVSHFFLAEDSSENSHREIWDKFLAKVGQFGRVLLACHVGSRCYNLHTPQSDADMIVIVAVPTEETFSYEGLRQTIKNEEGYEPDFTIHEVSYFCELLLSGDTRMTELLFQDPNSIVFQSPEFEELFQIRHKFLSKSTIKKYVSELTGVKGLKKLQTLKSQESDPQQRTRMFKHFYILLRLLFCAEQIIDKGELKLWMSQDSQERDFFMKIREEKLTYEHLYELTVQKKEYIEKKLAENIPLPENSLGLWETLNNWLTAIRMEHFEEPPTGNTTCIVVLISLEGQKQESLPLEPSLKSLLEAGGAWKDSHLIVLCKIDPVATLNFTNTLTINDLIGMYSVNARGLWDIPNSTKKEAVASPTMYEIGKDVLNVSHLIARFIQQILSGNPNALWIFYQPQNILYAHPLWNLLYVQRNTFITSKAVHQTVALLKWQITATQQKPKNPKLQGKNQPFAVDKSFAAILFLVECFRFFLNSSENNLEPQQKQNVTESITHISSVINNLRVASDLQHSLPEAGLEVTKELCQLAEELKLEDWTGLSKLDLAFLKSWCINVRKHFFHYKS